MCKYAERPYLIGDTYYNQAIPAHKFFLFTKNPDNKINGNLKIGVIDIATLGELNKLPTKNPIELAENARAIVIN